MRKLLFCVPMIAFLLTGCGRIEVSQEEQLALEIRGEYLEMTACRAELDLTADYGQRVYRYHILAGADGEQVAMTLTAPESVAGITARYTGEKGQLEFDGLWLESGVLDRNGLTPASAFPVLLEEARSGYIIACCMEADGTLRVDCGDPQGTPGQGREVSLWFDGEDHGLVRGEISVDGFRSILCEFSEFTMEEPPLGE